MSNLVLKKTTTAIFLTIVLIGGTFAAISPSFITGVNAEPYYGMDKDRKSDKKDVSVQSLKCNNINVNVNGLELSVLPPFLGGGEGLAADAAEPNTDSGSLAADNNGEGSQINDFRFICINNNNNTVIEEETPLTPVEECAETDEIEACFANAEFMGQVQFPAFVDALESGITIEINGQDITLRSFEDICVAFEGITTYEQLTDAVNQIGIETGATFGEGFFAVVNCLAEAIGIPIPSDNI